MKIAGWITLFYAVFILVGGVMGQIRAASTTSLVVGTVFGLLLFLSAMGMFKDKLFPAYMGLILTLLLDAFFTYRYLVTLAFIPAGLGCLVSLVVLIVLATLLRSHLQKERK